MNKFEQLIEYVINDEDSKAHDLFHEIVVEKSREIYENLLNDEIGGDEVDDLISDIEVEEEGFAENEDEENFGMIGGDEAEFDADVDSEFDYDADGEHDEHEEDHADVEDRVEDMEDRVVDLEDKLDELMAEFEDMMSGEDSDNDMDMSADDSEVDSLEESVDLTAAPKPVTAEEGTVNKKSANADNSGKKAGVKGKPVMSSGSESGKSAPSVKDMGYTTKPNMKAAPKPKTGE